MSSQDTAGIPFSASHRLQAFKLLELPPELLALLESENPPTLYVKTASSTCPPATAQALLCAPDATYRIQQKNSSNPLMILEPTISPPNEESEILVSALTTIATIEDTLELSKQENETTPASSVRVNKWHEKFAKGRVMGNGKE